MCVCVCVCVFARARMYVGLSYASSVWVCVIRSCGTYCVDLELCVCVCVCVCMYAVALCMHTFLGVLDAIVSGSILGCVLYADCVWISADIVSTWDCTYVPVCVWRLGSIQVCVCMSLLSLECGRYFVDLEVCVCVCVCVFLHVYVTYFGRK